MVAPVLALLLASFFKSVSKILRLVVPITDFYSSREVRVILALSNAQPQSLSLRNIRPVSPRKVDRVR